MLVPVSFTITKGQVGEGKNGRKGRGREDGEHIVKMKEVRMWRPGPGAQLCWVLRLEAEWRGERHALVPQCVPGFLVMQME